MRHIVFITPGFPADESDSICVPYLQALVNEIIEKKIARITVIAIHYPYKKRKYSWNGVEVHACGGSNRGWMRLFILNRATKIFKQINKEQRIDGIQSFWLNDSAVVGYLMAKKYKYPHWVTLMGQDVLPSNRFINFFKRINSSKKRQYLETITLCDFHNRQFLHSTGKESDHIISFGLDVKRLPTIQKMTRTIDLLGVGGLIKLKNYEVFLNTIAELKKKRPDISCMLVGNGPERAHLETLAQKLDLRHNLTFASGISRDEVIEIMMQSKVLIHPSHFESYGYVFVEALYAGMQIVSSPVGLAEASSRWHIIHNEEDWVPTIESVLENSHDYSSCLLEDISETALAYRRVWES